jgi:putative pyruvate formate lyase activating enzyme
MMLDLQSRGSHNINFVTPTHVVPSMAAAILYAARNGLTIPIVYNSSGYDSVQVIRELSGIVDIYLPDAKYADDATAERISGFRDYAGHNRAAIGEMYNQVGVLSVSNGIAERGLLVRHLILPDGLSGTASVMSFLADHISPDVPVSIMDQYFPAHRALEDTVLSRRITHDEYDTALQAFHDAGLTNGYIQDHFEE